MMLLLKTRVRGHTRRLPSGRPVLVRPYVDSRHEAEDPVTPDLFGGPAEAPVPRRPRRAPSQEPATQDVVVATPDVAPAPALTGDALIAAAINELQARLRVPGDELGNPGAARDLVRLKLGAYPHEMFACLWLDNRHRLIDFQEMFRGTIDGASVHPREVVREAMARNAAAVILVHNHPSGVASPSRADEQLTRRLKDSLAFVDVRVLDHLIVGGDRNLDVVSFAERGLI
jgi:DNA repair protein RadC